MRVSCGFHSALLATPAEIFMSFWDESLSYWNQSLIHRICCDFTRHVAAFELRFCFLQFLGVMVLYIFSSYRVLGGMQWQFN